MIFLDYQKLYLPIYKRYCCISSDLLIVLTKPQLFAHYPPQGIVETGSLLVIVSQVIKSVA
jgi:hypothetical protein